MPFKKLITSILFIFLCGVSYSAVEDFTTYTEVDPTTEITITSTRVHWVYGLETRDTIAYVYKDHGVDSIGPSIDYYVDFKPIQKLDNFSGDVVIVGATDTSASVFTSWASGWMMTSDVNSGNWEIGIMVYDETQRDMSAALTLNTQYYLTIDNGGGTTTMSVNVYTDAARTTLLTGGDISATSASMNADYRYLYVTSTKDINATSRFQEAYIDNLDLAPSAGGGGNPAVTNFSILGEVNFHGNVSIN